MLSLFMFIGGIVVLARGRYPWGSTREVRGGTARLVGFLMLITPVAFFAYGVYLGAEAARQGKADPTDDKDFQKLILLEVGITVGMLIVCALISVMSAVPRSGRLRRPPRRLRSPPSN
jgi:hypothetical protein